MTKICVGMRNNGTIDVDMSEDEDIDDEQWNCFNLSITEATFLYDELHSAIIRAKARKITDSSIVCEIPKINDLNKS